MKAKFKTKSSGIAAIFIILAIVIILVVVFGLVFMNMKLAKKPAPLPEEPEKGKMPEPVYETVVKNIKFSLVKVEDRGNALPSSESRYPQRIKTDATTTDKFIKVIISAQNLGTENTRRHGWEVAELVDSDGRKFYSAAKADYWLPLVNDCDAILKPNFTPTPCIIIYEVSKKSIGLRVRVDIPDPASGKNKPEDESFIDLPLYNEKYCWDDSDCDCGLNRYTRDCFLGNKTYVASSTLSISWDSISTSSQTGSALSTSTRIALQNCFPFCRGAMGEVKTKCINNTCSQATSF